MKTPVNLCESRDIIVVTMSLLAMLGYDSLHTRQIEIKKEIDSYLLFNDEAKRLKIFNLTLANVKNDIEFTLAKLKEIMVNLENSDTEKNIRKDIQLEKQIRELKNQVEKSK